MTLFTELSLVHGGPMATITSINHSTLVKSMVASWLTEVEVFALSHIKVPLKIHLSLTTFRDVVYYMF